MKVTPLKTHKITPGKETIFQVLSKYLPKIKEKSILAVTSKIVSICEGNVIKIDKVDRIDLIKKEAEYYLPSEKSKYNSFLTIKKSNLMTSAGVDKSNGNGYYVLWPKNPQQIVNSMREYLVSKFKLKNVGVIITDSKKIPLRRGAIGFAITHSGFKAVNNYVGKPDIFGQPLRVTRANIIDALATATVAVIGEGNEQTPLAIIEDVPFVKFQSRNPNREELNELRISLEDDLYSPLFTSIKWSKRT